MSTSQQRAFRYVPALDGVRALSLAAILVFHSHVPWARGGFLGVTVFFTLSGFLITSLLLTERERTGRISLRSFWVRRARRLAPAVLVLFGLVAVLLGTGLVAGRASVAEDALATAGWSANWRFVLSGQSYGDLFSGPTPFQHMWSLAVEEQFYLLFPGLLLLLLGRAERLRRWRALLAAGAGVALSTWLCASLAHPGSVERSYYGTDTRLAEPLVGVVLALLLTRGGAVRVLPRWARHALDVAGLGALAWTGWLVHGYGQYSLSLYRGGFLLVAVLSAVLLAGVTQPGSLLGRVLALPPLVLLGRVSYGGYVFHWPVFLWLSPERTGLGGGALFSLRAATTVLLAVVSYALVEEPVRVWPRLQVRWALPAWAASTTLVLAALVLASGTVTAPPATAVASSAPGGEVVPPLPSAAAATRPPSVPAAKVRPTRARPAATTAPAVPGPASPSATATSSAAAVPPVPRTHVANPAAPGHQTRIALVGDSLAYNLGGGMTRWAQSVGSAVVDNLGISGCPLALGGTTRFPDGYERPVQAACNWWDDPTNERLQQLQAFDPQVILVQDGMNEVLERKLDSWPTYRRVGDPTFDAYLRKQYRDFLGVVNPGGTRKVVFLDAVCADWNRVEHFQGFAPELDTRITALNQDYATLSRATGVPVADLRGHLCPNGQYSDTVDGVPNARPDGYHLSDQASLAVATKWLGPLSLDAVKS